MRARGRKTTTRRRKTRPSRTTASPRRRNGATAVTDIAALRRDLAEAQELLDRTFTFFAQLAATFAAPK